MESGPYASFAGSLRRAGREAVIPAALAAQALLSGIILMGNK